MCRMILAYGNFCTLEVFQAAADMSNGVTANHDSPLTKHSDGWGSIWLDNANIKTSRSSKWLSEEMDSLNLDHIDSRILAIHARHSTLAENLGESFSHPIQKYIDAETWYMMHNGYLPTVHKKLGMRRSVFDSSEYLEYIANGQSTDSLSSELLNRKIAELEPGGSSANAIFIKHQEALVHQSYPKTSPFPKYFTMSICTKNGATYVSSEVILTLAPQSSWRPLNNGELIRFKI